MHRDPEQREIVFPNNDEADTAAYAVETTFDTEKIKAATSFLERLLDSQSQTAKSIVEILRQGIDPEKDQRHTLPISCEMLVLRSLTTIAPLVSAERKREMGIPEDHSERAEEMLLAYYEQYGIPHPRTHLASAA